MMFPFGKLKDLFKRSITKEGKLNTVEEEDTAETEKEIWKLFMTMYRMLNHDLKRHALREFGLDESELIIRSLVPQDFNLKKPMWKFKLRHGTAKMIDFIVHDFTTLGICGMHIPKDCPITQLTIRRVGAIIRILDIQHLSGDYFFDDPFTFRQNQNISFEAHNPTRRKTTSLKFYGIVIEKRGLRVNL